MREKIELKTRRLLLRPLGTEYLQTVHAYASDLENTKYMEHLPNDTIEETLDFLKNAEAEWAKEAPSFYEFAVLYEGRQIGAVSVYLEEDTAGGTGEPEKTGVSGEVALSGGTAPFEETAPSGKAVTFEESAPSGETAPSGKVAPSGETAPSGKAAPSGETAPSGKADLSGETAPSGKADLSGKTAPSGKAATFEESAPSGKTALSEKAAPAGELGWVFHKDYWGQGFASEAACALVEYAVRELKLRHFIAHCDAENPGSYRVMEKLGMTRTAVSHDRKNRASDETRTEYQYEMWREDGLGIF